ncbi:hypothetical protein [Actinomarinicola tropica]|uniref:DUF3352 domain-containing protein n=1 Tax=Actinomarinicola tropica TaxID=2789776 RepID=A0A5Q2RJU2_9ACTN|nr:hypothetical protein [Actinomarinicola tropica]QGG94317.1 hypothetical protein GH723_03935 [Actinomarinicola tropica]
MPTLRRALIPLFALTLAATACGDDDGGSGDGLSAGDGFSVEGALAELPDLGEPGAIVSVADLDAATELSGAERPDPADADAVREWLMGVSGADREADVFVPIAETLQPQGRIDEFAAELGWSVADVSTFAETSLPPRRVLVVSGDGLDDDVFDDADVVELEDDIVTAGEGEDHESDLEGTTAARPIGTPLRMAADDGRLVASPVTALVRGWLDDDLDTLADDEAHAAVAAALDGADVYAAVLWSQEAGSGSGGSDGPGLTASFDVVGIGWSIVGGEPVVTIAHHFADEATAEEQAERIRAILEEGKSLVTAQPMSDVLSLDEVTTDGAVTVATVRPAEGGFLGTPMQMLMQRDVLFVG